MASYRDKHPDFADWLENNAGLAVFTLPDAHHKRMRTSNGIERPIQQELKRRTSKVRVFPNLASLERLSTAVLIDEKWETETKIKWEQLDQLHDNFQTSGCVIVLKGRGGERQASFEQVVRAQEREEAAGAIEARPAVRHSWPRPALEEVEERLEVAEDACSCCVANGSHQDHRDQKRRIVRRGCDYPGSPSEVAAVSRHRIRVWTHVLHERVHAALAPRRG